MHFSVGDKVVHPHHGPGWISGVQQRELLDGIKRYYVIEIPGPGLTVHMPVGTAGQVGMRLAMPQARVARVLSILRGKPHGLPKNFRERQEQIGAQISTRRVTQLVRVVRDLTCLREQAHLTKVDSDFLRQGRDLLVAEMALVSGETVSAMNKRVEAAMAAGVAAY